MKKDSMKLFSSKKDGKTMLYLAKHQGTRIIIEKKASYPSWASGDK